MTKLRTPRTWADATHRVGDTIGYDVAANAVGKSESLIRQWSNPDSDKRPSIDQALTLDAAYLAAGGEEPPHLQAFEFQLGAATDRKAACSRALAAEVATIARETGDAVAAAMVLITSTASNRDVHRAFAEAQELARAADALLRRVASFLPSNLVPDAGKLGGTHQ